MFLDAMLALTPTAANSCIAVSVTHRVPETGKDSLLAGVHPAGGQMAEGRYLASKLLKAVNSMSTGT